MENYEEVFTYSNIHNILRKQLEKISKSSHTFLKKASIFNEYIVEDSIAELIGINHTEKEEIINELLEHKIIKEGYYKDKKEYVFCNRELKHMLYHEIGKDKKKELHTEVGNIILKYIKQGRKYILEEMIYQFSKTNRGKIALETILNKALEYKKKYRADSQYLWGTSIFNSI